MKKIIFYHSKISLFASKRRFRGPFSEGPCLVGATSEGLGPKRAENPSFTLIFRVFGWLKKPHFVVFELKKTFFRAPETEKNVAIAIQRTSIES